MGHGTRNNGQISTFWPDDTDTTKYLISSDYTTLEAILEKITEWWPDAKMSEIVITSECIHTDRLTYDLYDPSDYTNFIVIERLI